MAVKMRSIEGVTKFALISLSSVLYTMHRTKTMKSIAVEAKCSPNVLSAIKNDSIKSISLNKVLQIITNLGIEYTTTISLRGGIEYHSFELGGYGQFGQWNKNKYKEHFTAPRQTITKKPKKGEGSPSMGLID